MFRLNLFYDITRSRAIIAQPFVAKGRLFDDDDL